MHASNSVFYNRDNITAPHTADCRLSPPHKSGLKLGFNTRQSVIVQLNSVNW